MIVVDIQLSIPAGQVVNITSRFSDIAVTTI